MMVKVLTINTWKCDGDYDQRLLLLRDQIAATGADIIFIQEAFRTPDLSYCTLRYLAQSLRYYYSFVPARRKKRKINNVVRDSFSGLGMLSRFPFHNSENIVLPSTLRDGGRSAQLEIVHAYGKKILLANIHLSFLRERDNLKVQQLERILNKLVEVEGVDLYCIGGDFNSVPNSKTIEYLKSYSFIRFMDVFDLSNDTVENPITFWDPFNKSGAQIDYIFFGVNKGDEFPLVHSAEVALNESNALGIFPSDHFGVLAKFDFFCVLFLILKLFY